MVIKEGSWSRIITYLFLFVVLTGALATYESDAKVYLAVVLYLILFLPVLICNPKVRLNRFPTIVAIIMILVWMYGLFLGIVLGNDKTSIVRNFAGMTVYIMVIPLLNSNVKIQEYIDIIKKVSKYAVLVSCVTYILLTFLDFRILYSIPVINAFVGGGGIGGFVQYFCRELIHVSFAYSFYILIAKNEDIFKNLLWIALTMFVMIVVNDSGGDLFAMGIIAVVVLFTKGRHLNKRIIMLMTVAIVALLAIYFQTGSGLLSKLFSSNDGGNIRRWIEINYLLKNITLFGHGLGAALSYAGSDSYNYGTEMIYLNIFHKFGVFAVLILACYAYTFVKAIDFLRRDFDRNPDRVIPLALMAYLIPSLANPMLFGVLAVISHLLSMIIIANYDYEKKIEEGVIVKNEDFTYRD